MTTVNKIEVFWILASVLLVMFFVYTTSTLINDRAATPLCRTADGKAEWR